ncbi:MAG TPA: hypothetical protein PKC28_15765, partial [Bdellovibrionales bacterium]|nr:hypothetical protein [Bdellovibrionales bacterium]
MSSSRLKHVIFDIALFTYTVALLSGFIWWTAAKFGYPVHPPDQEKFEALISHHGFALFVLPSAAILILRLHRFARWSTVGDMLFAHPKSTRAALVHLLVSAALTLILSVVVTEASLAELLDQDGLAGAIRLWDG